MPTAPSLPAARSARDGAAVRATPPPIAATSQSSPALTIFADPAFPGSPRHFTRYCHRPRTGTRTAAVAGACVPGRRVHRDPTCPAPAGHAFRRHAPPRRVAMQTRSNAFPKHHVSPSRLAPRGDGPSTPPPPEAGPRLPETGFLRQSQVLALVPVSKSTLWRRVQARTFPQPVKLSARVTAWRAEDLRQWIRDAAAP